MTYSRTAAGLVRDLSSKRRRLARACRRRGPGRGRRVGARRGGLAACPAGQVAGQARPRPTGRTGRFDPPGWGCRIPTGSIGSPSSASACRPARDWRRLEPPANQRPISSRWAAPQDAPRTVCVMNDTPRDADGAKLCSWCGAEIRQSGIGRSRDYCRRSCRQRAYEQRRVDDITKANARLIRRELTQQFQTSAVSSRDDYPTPHDSSRDETRRPAIPSRDETGPAGPAPVPAQAADAAPPSRPAPPSGARRRRLLPAPPGTQRTGAEETQLPLLGFGFGSPEPKREAADGE